MDELTVRYIVRLYPSDRNDSPAAKEHFYQGARWHWGPKAIHARLFVRVRFARRIEKAWHSDVKNNFWKCEVRQVLCQVFKDGSVLAYEAGAEPDEPNPTP